MRCSLTAERHSRHRRARDRLLPGSVRRPACPHWRCSDDLADLAPVPGPGMGDVRRPGCAGCPVTKRPRHEGKRGHGPRQIRAQRAQDRVGDRHPRRRPAGPARLDLWPGRPERCWQDGAAFPPVSHQASRTVIFSSHILADVQRIADQVGILREGRIGPDAIRIDATSIAAGERGIPAVIAACGARQVSCEPAAAVWNPRSSP